jgi:hypothetical protein
MSEFYDLDKEETLYNFIIGTLTTMKARGDWNKEAQKDLFNSRIPGMLDTLCWSRRDKFKVTYRNTKHLVIDIDVHYAGKDKSWGEVIRCDEFENFFYEPDLEILDICRHPRQEQKERTIRDDMITIMAYVNEFVHLYRSTFTRWTIKKQKDLLANLKRILKTMIVLKPEYESVSIDYIHTSMVQKSIQFEITIQPSDHDEEPKTVRLFAEHEDDMPLPDLMREPEDENNGK